MMQIVRYEENQDPFREEVGYVAIEENTNFVYQTYLKSDIIRDLPKGLIVLPKDIALSEFIFKKDISEVIRR